MSQGSRNMIPNSSSRRHRARGRHASLSDDRDGRSLLQPLIVALTPSKRTTTASRPAIPVPSPPQSPPPLSPFLMEILMSCQNHAATIHGAMKDNNVDDTSDAVSSSSASCNDVLDSIRRLLPSVEATVQSMEDLCYLCDFYNNSMMGGFCPLSPRLWSTSIHVLPRVVYLLQSLSSLDGLADELPATSLTTFDRVCTTISRLLNKVPDSNWYGMVLLDWMYLAKDLTILSESDLLPSMEIDRGFVGGVGVLVAEVGLFEGSVRSTDWPSNGLPPPAYTVQVSNVESLVVLQTAVLKIFAKTVTLHKDRRLSYYTTQTEREAVLEVGLEDLDARYYTAGDVDLFVLWESHGNESVRSMLLALRHALLTHTSTMTNLLVECETTRRLVRRLQRAALDVLLLFSADWHRDQAPSLRLLREVSLLVSRACRDFLMGLSWTSEDAEFDASLELDISKGLAELVSSLIHLQPRVEGSTSISYIEAAIYSDNFPILCESISYMKVDERNDTVNQSKLAEFQRPLNTVVLRTIHTMIVKLERTDKSVSEFVDVLYSNPLFLTREGSGCLFRMLGDRALSDNAVLILSHFVRPILNSGSILAIIHASLASSSELKGNRELAIEHDEPWEESGPLKRKRPSPHSDHESTAKLFVSEDCAKKSKVSSFIGSGGSSRQSLLYFTDELLRLFSEALMSVSRLRAVFIENAPHLQFPLTDPTLAPMIHGDTVIVTNILRLLLEATRNASDERSFPPVFSTIVDDILGIVTAINESILSTFKSGNDAADHVLAIGELGVLCGVFIKESIDVWECSQQLIFSKAVTCAASASDLWQHICRIRRKAGMSSSLQAFCRSIYGLSTRFDCAAVQPRILRSFPDLVVSIGVRKPEMFRCNFTARFTLLDQDAGSQIARLEMLSDCIHLDRQLVASVSGMEERILLASQTFDMSHPDPLLRLAMWQSLAWIVTTLDPARLRHMLASTYQSSNGSTYPGIRIVRLLVGISFADPDASVRQYCAHELGKVLSAQRWCSFLALMTNEDEWHRQVKDLVDMDAGTPPFSIELVKGAANRFFGLVDSMRSANSFSQKSTQHDAIVRRNPEDSALSFTFTRSASCALCSLCIDFHSILGKVIMENSVLRIAQIWAAVGTTSLMGERTICYLQLCVLLLYSTIELQLQLQNQDTFAPVFFQELLKPVSKLLDNNAKGMLSRKVRRLIERQFCHLSAFIYATFVEDRQRSQLQDEGELERLVEICIPPVLTHLIAQKNYGILLLSAGYRRFVNGKCLIEYMRRRRTMASCIEGDLSGGSIDREARRTLSKQWSRSLDPEARQLCLKPGVIEQIVAKLLIRFGIDAMFYLASEILLKKISLHQLIKNTEMFILKTFVVEAGLNPDATASIVRAMMIAAAAQHSDASTATDNLLSADSNDSGDKVAIWVTSHFMFLLVNVVQHRWATKSDELRAQALRSLLFSFDFLLPSESSLYFPQIMATVNAALVERVDPEDVSSLAPTFRLRYLAVQVLDKFLRLVAQNQWEIIGQNLTSIVVSLVPTLADDEGCPSSRSLDKESRECAVSLLEWLAKGDLGSKLTSYFSEIPFLPPSNALESVRASLSSHGVTFDDLQVLRLSSVEAGSVGSDSVAVLAHPIRQNALRRRLQTVCPLLENESASIRRVSLKHVTAILRANREIFHALIENEGMASVKRFVTLAYRGKIGWTITDLFDMLLSRCVQETDAENRVLLATCFGEVGAISVHRLDDISASTSWQSGEVRVPTAPPWYSTPYHFQLHALIDHLVYALKAAPTSSDQNKIAFAIQQVLALLNETAKEVSLVTHSDSSTSVKTMNSNTTRDFRHEDTTKAAMEASLAKELIDAQILDIVEPFWLSEFHEAEQSNYRHRDPPFFRNSSTLFGWISNWSRYMVHRAHRSRRNGWTHLFFACRTALRTQAGLGVAEFLLPILILDCLCYGSGQDQATLRAEVHDVLTSANNASTCARIMSLTDRRKAITMILTTVELFAHWTEPELEAKYSKKMRYHGTRKTTLHLSDSRANGGDWQLADVQLRIQGLRDMVPLSLCARAAAGVGMHACALRYLEMASRLTVAGATFGPDVMLYDHRNQNRSRAAGSCPEEDISVMKDVLVSLNDFETMTALSQDDAVSSPLTRTRDCIRLQEALLDWQGAWQNYERAQQLEKHEPFLRLGALRCLVELGHFDSVLQHVDMNRASPDDDSTPLAVEAAWRLGRWDKLSELVEASDGYFLDPLALYQFHLGRVMLHVRRKDLPSALSSLKNARHAVMEGLSSAARESYARAYDHIIRLQTLREIEDVSVLVCSSSQSSRSLEEYVEDSGLCWSSRLGLASSSGGTPIINTRLALAKLAGDFASESSLYIRMGKVGRKRGHFDAAASSFSLAEAALDHVDSRKKASLLSSLRLQSAKLRHACGDSGVALRILGLEDIETMVHLDDRELVGSSYRRVLDSLRIEKHCMDEKGIMDVFVRSALQSTQWMVEGGLKGGAEVIARFRVIHRLAPGFEKGHFQFARYIDSLLQARIMVLQGRSAARLGEERQRYLAISSDSTCMRFVGLIVKHFAEAVILDIKHVYQALPRLLSLWFEFASIESDMAPDQLASVLLQCQDETNTLMASTFKRISAQALYTALPQLISRLTHNNNDTATVVQAMLRRVLTKYPAQALWPLAWIRQSRDAQRQRIGVEIFHQATMALSKSESLRKLLVTSKILIDYLFSLAIKEVGDQVRDSMRIKPLSDEVDLSEFVPPIQAALSVSLVSGDNSRSRDVFPRHIPRMRAFDDIVGVMNSKAKPKRLRAFVVNADSLSRVRSSSKVSKDYDIGEIHFLIKQEAKGDLRKDARVQDLNNVINRVMSSTGEAKGLSVQRRRLHLRTFTVTCLSEDTGLLEWVPHTVALRSVISKTYNPQADVLHGKRHGKRITDFNDARLRITFEKKCQEVYFTTGNLSKAAALFESECLKSYPPVMYWWYVQQFQDPHAWYEARTRFTLSAAIWSAVGHVIGLGDRHSENILLDKSTGECVHVDFDCIFDKGLHLPKPEVVPFRLTQNMVDAFGPTGADGMFSGNLMAAMNILRENRDTLLSVLEPFVKDPVINWKRYRSQQHRNSSNGTSKKSADDEMAVEAKQMSVIDERLRGIYNLRNPNYKKFRRSDRLDNPDEEDFSHPIPLSVEGQVHKMIAEATSSENLVQLYVGWMPWV